MKCSLVGIVAVLTQTCFCAGLEAGVGHGIREVVIDSGGDPVVELIDHQPEYATYWSKAQSILVEKQFGLSSKTSIEEQSTVWPLRWIEFLDGSWLNEILLQCDRDPVFKAGVTQNLSAMQAFVAFVSIGYAIVAMWLGPIKLTRWQQRTVLVTYSAAGTVQAIFLMHAFRFLDIHYAYPSTLALAIVFFVAFNLTNVLLVLESDEPEDAVQVQVQQIVEASSTRVITAQRAACF